MQKLASEVSVWRFVVVAVCWYVACKRCIRFKFQESNSKKIAPSEHYKLLALFEYALKKRNKKTKK